MGYTHYWRRKSEVSKEAMAAIVKDFQAAVEIMEDRVPLAGGDGSGKPLITESVISFNGVEDCGHAKRDLGITWPAEHAGGVQMQPDLSGKHWFAGALLQSRTCGGDCSHETCLFERVITPQRWQQPDERGMFFTFCKTAFKPYDFAVCVFLIIAKHHMEQSEEELVVSSDGDESNFDDAKMFCQHYFDYGMSPVLETR
jgi:hypothetical protein